MNEVMPWMRRKGIQMKARQSKSKAEVNNSKMTTTGSTVRIFCLLYVRMFCVEMNILQSCTF